MPDLAVAVSVPRLVAIEYPLGRTLGQPGDASGQLAVLRATLQALEAIQVPGGRVDLPFEWSELPNQVHNHPVEDPPIVRYIMRYPWTLLNLLNRNVPK